MLVSVVVICCPGRELEHHFQGLFLLFLVGLSFFSRARDFSSEGSEAVAQDAQRAMGAIPADIKVRLGGL